MFANLIFNIFRRYDMVEELEKEEANLNIPKDLAGNDLKTLTQDGIFVMTVHLYISENIMLL